MIKVKKLVWIELEDELLICDLGFCIWKIYSDRITPYINILLNGRLWHEHNTIEGAIVMVENRMSEYVVYDFFIWGKYSCVYFRLYR